MKIPALLQRLTTLQIALGVSVAVHAMLLTVRFVDPEGFNRVFQDTPLEVILVNAKSAERPDQAQAIAQASLAGGGDAAQGRATSPLPYSALNAIGDDLEDAQRKMDQMQEQQAQLLAQLRRQLAALELQAERLLLERLQALTADWGTDPDPGAWLVPLAPDCRDALRKLRAAAGMPVQD